MKKLAILFLVPLLPLLCDPPPAPSKQTVMGAGSFGAETLDSLTTMGLVKLHRTRVTHALSVNGSLIAQGATLGSIEVIGEANLTDTLVQNGGTILGYLQTHGTTIAQPLILNGQKAVFTASKLKQITIQAVSAFKSKQIIELRQKTLVEGPIHFESGKGEVHLYSGSQVTGPVTGGKVIKKT